MKKPIKQKKVAFKHKIAMLIDDNDLDNMINQKILEANAFAEIIYVNSSSMSALEFLKNLEASGSSSQHLLPDYIFVDLNMPIIDGVQFIDMFYKNNKPLLSKCKLAVLTSSINPNDKVKVSNVDPQIPFINKPLTSEILSGLN
ncbi:MAG: Response regulator of ato, ornithine decarboxylase antizyme [Bacteroidota bacterium]|jgi:CheY-like chemotaxis protein|nr:Response regulator of ato, ornithine decarboxylase antizyme [Bacteroidota bacterium]